MRFRYALPLLFLAAPFLCAAPPEVPATLTVDPGQLVRVVAKGDKIGFAKSFKDDDAFFDELAPQPGTRRYVFQATKPGTYFLSFWTVGEDTGSTTVITVRGSVPPTPIPPGPPIPVDDFTKAVQAAFALETAPDRAISVGKLASLYRQAAKVTVNDPALTTYGQLFDVMKKASVSMIPETAIPQVRRVVGTRLNSQFSAAASPLDRAKIGAEFAAVAEALSAIK